MVEYLTRRASTRTTANPRALVTILLALSLCARGAQADSFNVSSFGGIYGKSDAATVATNDQAVAQAIASIVKTGGGDLRLTGSLAISQTINFPTVSYNGVAGYPVHFSIAGSGENAELYDVNGGVAIAVAPKYPANLPGIDLRQSVCDLAIRGGAVTVTGGGKFFDLRNVRIYGVTGAATALSVDLYDGGHLDDVYVHNSPGVEGFRITNSHMTLVDITSRENGSGGSIVSSTLDGRLYCESNKGIGLALDGLVRSTLQIWLENNNGNTIQGTRRNCWGNLFAGMDQSDSNTAWDDDPLSAAGNRSSSAATVLAGVGDLVGVGTPKRTVFADAFASLAGDAVVVHAGAFLPDNQVDPRFKNPCWVELAPTKADGKAADSFCDWQAGDQFIVTIDVAPDAAALAWYAKNPGVRLRVVFGGLSGIAPAQGEMWRVDGSVRQLVLLGTATAAGTGLRVFAFPQTGATSGPDGDLTIGLRATVRKLPAQRQGVK